MRTIVCAVCGKRFETSLRNAKYCSDECRAAARLQYHREYRRVSMGYEHATCHRNEAKMHIYTKICPECGREFRTNSSLKIFCGRICKDRWAVKRPEKRLDQRIPEIRERVAREQKENRISNKEAVARILEECAERERKKAEEKRRQEYERTRIRRTESGAVWYPVSGKEIQRIARETHRSYGEVCAEFLSKQVRVKR